MTDYQFSKILEGINSQGATIVSIVYSNGELCEMSLKELLKTIPNLKELSISNLTRGGSKSQLSRILESILIEGLSLEKLKLSNVCLNDHKIVNLICEIIKHKDFVT